MINDKIPPLWAGLWHMTNDFGNLDLLGIEFRTEEFFYG